MYTTSELRDLLRKDILLVVFTKADGTVREMLCTLRADLLPEYEGPKRRGNDHPDAIHVWDLEKEAWRAFKTSTVLEVHAE